MARTSSTQTPPSGDDITEGMTNENAGASTPGATPPDGVETPAPPSGGTKRIQHPGMKGRKLVVPGAAGKGELVQFDADGIVSITESQAAYLLSIPGYKEVK